MPNWPKIENLGIAGKISLIVALFAIVSIGAGTFAYGRIQNIVAGYADVVTRVSPSAALSARASRMAQTYLLRSYQLLVENTEAGNALRLRQAGESSADYLKMMDEVRRNIPEQAAFADETRGNVVRALALCEPSVRFAATTTSVADNLKAAERLKAECAAPIEDALTGQLNFTARLIAYAADVSAKLRAETNAALLTTLVLVCAGLLLSVAAALWIGLHGMSRPIRRLNAVMARFAGDDLDADTPGMTRRDEIGAMARTVEVFKVNAVEMGRLRAEQETLKHEAAAERRQAMLELAGRFEASAGGIVTRVGERASEMQATALSMAAVSEETSRQSVTVAAASEQATQNVNTVAAASEQLAASVNEILQQITRSTEIVGEAVGDADAARGTMRTLAAAVQRIGEVVGLIRGIAAQTNLLALNATIEAARAGDAGKGFAVVASEVKALANQTGKATEDIAVQIAAIQEATDGSVQSIHDIGARIGRISETASAIASAVEQQGAATREIARNVTEAARGTGEVSATIADVTNAAGQSRQAADRVLAAAKTLNDDSAALTTQVATFLREVRAA